MAAKIELGDLRPFLAPVLLEAVGRAREAALLKKVVAEIVAQARRSSNRRRRILLTSDVEVDDGLILQAVVYRETGPPSWLPTEGLEDVHHHLIVAAVRGRHVAICASDGVMRERIVKNLRIVRRMPREAIAAFVGPEAKAIWLNGIHTPTSSKPDTKAMTGTTLEYALDPIGDQTFYYSAARTVPGIPGLETDNGRPTLVGAAPAGGRVWVSRPESWQTFKAQLAAVIDHATSGVRPENPFEALARPVENGRGVGEAYGLSVVPEELLSEDEIPNAVREAARRWAFDAVYEVTARAGLSLRVEPHLDGRRLGLIDLLVSLQDGAVVIEPVWITQEPGMEALCAECAQFLGDADRVKIYYESGHAVAQGRCYAGGYTDQPFAWDFQSFAGYDVTKEKPPVPKKSDLAAQIGIAGDDSLFAYVCQKMFVGPDGRPKGWLASDDGSMELADFIHIDPDRKVISLVHVKASSKKDDKRMAAPAEYEVVVSQGVKNLRHLDRRHLVDELDRGKGKKIGAAVWHDGVKQPDREGFLRAARRLPQAALKTLVILQPRVTAREVTRCLAPNARPNDALRMKQINTLMLAARASALACGAQFVGIADSHAQP